MSTLPQRLILGETGDWELPAIYSVVNTMNVDHDQEEFVATGWEAKTYEGVYWFKHKEKAEVLYLALPVRCAVPGRCCSVIYAIGCGLLAMVRDRTDASTLVQLTQDSAMANDPGEKLGVLREVGVEITACCRIGYPIVTVTID